MTLDNFLSNRLRLVYQRRNKRSSPHRRGAGFTLTELLIVVAIIVLLILLILLTMKTQLARGRDARRKADLDRIQKSFEEIYNDASCYPDFGILENCGSGDLSPYIKAVPCDPSSHEPYLHVVGAPDACTSYHVCAKLEDRTDPDIARIGCHPYTGCGFGADYNYCVAVGSTVAAAGFDPSIGTATPTPTIQYAGDYACTPGGVCNLYDDPLLHGCPTSFASPVCNNQCGNPANRCAD